MERSRFEWETRGTFLHANRLSIPAISAQNRTNLRSFVHSHTNENNLFWSNWMLKWPSTAYRIHVLSMTRTPPLLPLVLAFFHEFRLRTFVSWFSAAIKLLLSACDCVWASMWTLRWINRSRTDRSINQRKNTSQLLNENFPRFPSNFWLAAGCYRSCAVTWSLFTGAATSAHWLLYRVAKCRDHSNAEHNYHTIRSSVWFVYIKRFDERLKGREESNRQTEE